MDETTFSARIRDVCASLEQKRFAEAAGQARALKKSLLSGGMVDPIQLGWARFYEIKALSFAHAWQEGYDVASSMEPAPFALTLKNGAFCYGVGAECAMHLGMADEVARLGMLALEAREKAGDHAACLLAAQTGCQLLREIQRDDLNTPFAQHLIQRGRERMDADALCHGFHHLLANHAASYRADLVPVLVGGAPELRAWVGRLPAHGDLYAIAGAIEGAPFFEGALDGAARAQRQANGRLWKAASDGDCEGIDTEVDAGADPSWLDPRQGANPTPLHVAAFRGHLEAVQRLVELGATIDVPSAQDRTALHLAAAAGHVEIVGFLLAAGAGVDARDFCHQTALHLAAVEDFSDVALTLLLSGADPNAQDLAGCTPLSCATGSAGADTIAALLDRGAAVDIPSHEGQTPLMFAAMEGNADILQLLILRGAQVEARDVQGMSALDFALREKHADAEGILRDAQRTEPRL